MALMNMGVKTVTERMPKVISPKTHAIIDYATAGGFFLGAALFWRNHKRAAIGSLVCGLIELGTAMATDYPGGVTDGGMSFKTHGKIDAVFGPSVGMLPNLMAFSDDGQAYFFRAQAMAMTATTGLTDWEAEDESPRRRRRRAA